MGPFLNIIPQVALQAHKISHNLLRWKTKDDFCTNSHYLTYTFIFNGWENVLFELGRVNIIISFFWCRLIMWMRTGRSCCPWLGCLRNRWRKRTPWSSSMTLLKKEVALRTWRGRLKMRGGAHPNRHPEWAVSIASFMILYLLWSSQKCQKPSDNLIHLIPMLPHI